MIYSTAWFACLRKTRFGARMIRCSEESEGDSVAFMFLSLMIHSLQHADPNRDVHHAKKAVFPLICVMVFIGGCGLLPDAGESGTDGELLRQLNAERNNNKTIRFEVNPIKVYIQVYIQNIPNGREQVEVWAEATDGLIQFEFVGDAPETGITIKYGVTSPIACGVTFEPEWSAGVIKKAEIEIDPKTVLPIGLLGCRQTVKHEVGHALGLLGHTKDGGLMDADGGNGEITPQVKRIMKKIYSLPPNSDVSNVE